MNRKSRFPIPGLVVISFVHFASLACFSGWALAQKKPYQDLRKEEEKAAEKAVPDKASAEKAAAEEAAAIKDAEDLLRKTEEPVTECDRLKAEIKAAQDHLANVARHHRGHDWPQELAEANKDIEHYTKVIKETQHDNDQEWRTIFLNLLKLSLSRRESCNRILSYGDVEGKIKQRIDNLLNKLADCKSKNPMDAQFDCLKSKFPEVDRSLDKKDTAFDPASKRNFAWDDDKQAWIDTKSLESICPPRGIDPCLVGTWECTSFKEPNNKYFTGGGTGFRVTFKSDGTETVDYSSMQPTKAGPIDTIAFTGTGSAKISTDKGVAKIEATQNAGVSMTLKSTGRVWTMKYPGLGPGGLASPENKNNYKCTEDSLEYQTSYQRGQYTCTVKLTKVKP
jgi:hypothetical protein